MQGISVQNDKFKIMITVICDTLENIQGGKHVSKYPPFEFHQKHFKKVT